MYNITSFVWLLWHSIVLRPFGRSILHSLGIATLLVTAQCHLINTRVCGHVGVFLFLPLSFHAFALAA
jgi:hypothetical protein